MAGKGGKREGAGRKPKATEQQIAEKLSPLDDLAFEALKSGVERKEYVFVKLFYEYRYGKAKQQIDLTNGGEAFEKMPSWMHTGIPKPDA